MSDERQHTHRDSPEVENDAPPPSLPAPRLPEPPEPRKGMELTNFEIPDPPESRHGMEDDPG